MTSTVLYRNIQRRLSVDHLQSSEILLLSNDSLRQLLFIIGIVTTVLFVLLLCMHFIIKIRHLYRTTDVNKQNSISRRNSSRQRLPDIDHNSKRSSYIKNQCGKSTNYKHHMLNKYSNHEQIQDNNYQISRLDEISLLSVHIV
ncbi:unnamed protein product [Rotaria sordida]|uniref:Uncharacterized protein n=1 Tax=Rotaria sordida TaxID=392033 RepID=A0A818YLQ2_9BILA|nr:unnamed protein product [Rotaria sordida]CAF1292966.1 unnamed protein product [Rotaria sordida]CAF3756322.1 unnamed protein product [Rotaria sordida]CAF3829126.1 unnamed protein product [Rotaria sordida]